MNSTTHNIANMEVAWNQADLACPPNAQWRTQKQKFDVSAFTLALNKIIQDLESQDTLHTEAAALSRLVYRMKSKFRSDKGLKHMCKLNSALLKYLSLSLDKEYRKLKSYVEIDGKYVKLPSRQMVEYVLVRTQGFAKLMLRIEEMARLSAHFFKSRMNLGHAWCMSIVAYSIISRIWVLTRHMTKKSCAWYSSVYQFLKILESVGLQYLPKGQELPLDLKSWLGVEWINNPIPNVPDEEELKGAMFKLIKQGTSDSDEEVISDFNPDVKVEETCSLSVVVTPKRKHMHVSFADDTGEVISRDAFRQTLIKRPNTVEDSAKVHATVSTVSDDSVDSTDSENPATIDDVKTKSDLDLVLSQDTYPGLDKLRWNIIKNKSTKLLGTMEGKKESLVVKKMLRRIKTWIA